MQYNRATLSGCCIDCLGAPCAHLGQSKAVFACLLQVGAAARLSEVVADLEEEFTDVVEAEYTEAASRGELLDQAQLGALGEVRAPVCSLAAPA